MSGMGDPEKTIEAWKTAYERYCRQIDKEDELIDRRVNWLLTSQSILFAAVGLSGNVTGELLLRVVPWVGLCSSLAIGFTVWAASLSFMRYRSRLKNRVSLPDGEVKEHYPQLQRCPWIVGFGLAPSSLVPLMFSAAWTAVIHLKECRC